MPAPDVGELSSGKWDAGAAVTNTDNSQSEPRRRIVQHREPFAWPDPDDGAAGLPETASLMAELEWVQDHIRQYNAHPSDLDTAAARTDLIGTMQRITTVPRSPLRG